MLSVVLKLSLALLIITCVVNMGAQMIGKTQPANPALSGFRIGCEYAHRVCWYGVMVNETQVNNAWDMLKRHTYFLASSISNDASQRSPNNTNLQCGTYFIYEYRTVNGLIVKCRNLLLGEWLNMFGMPTSVGQYHDVLYYQGTRTMRVKIEGKLHPFAPITEFMFPIPRPFRESQYTWQGFAPRWRYCKLNIHNPC